MTTGEITGNRKKKETKFIDMGTKNKSDDTNKQGVATCSLGAVMAILQWCLTMVCQQGQRGDLWLSFLEL